jgi:hypothetical protein
VLLCEEEKNMHSETNRSPSTLAYEVSASASRMSPNLPSAASAMPPMLMRFSVARVLLRPARETKGRGAMKPTTRTRRYMFGRISHAAMSVGLPLVRAQKRRRERARGTERKVAMR